MGKKNETRTLQNVLIQVKGKNAIRDGKFDSENEQYIKTANTLRIPKFK
jgi:peptidoglycan hydrolase-like protein with peptidoglycan-binding domain